MWCVGGEKYKHTGYNDMKFVLIIFPSSQRASSSSTQCSVINEFYAGAMALQMFHTKYVANVLDARGRFCTKFLIAKNSLLPMAHFREESTLNGCDFIHL